MIEPIMMPVRAPLERPLSVMLLLALCVAVADEGALREEVPVDDNLVERDIDEPVTNVVGAWLVLVVALAGNVPSALRMLNHSVRSA